MSDAQQHAHSAAGALWAVLDSVIFASVLALILFGADWLIRQLIAGRRARAAEASPEAQRPA